MKFEEEKKNVRNRIESVHTFPEIIGNCPQVQETLRLVAKVAPTNSTVLILGETGTGKELIARAIHNNSPRRARPMITVNCAALPADLVESELFGHERGSFTGAFERRIGKFELAHNSSLFLDEIGELPLDLQVKLLRAIHEKEIERIGSKNTTQVDVRIIAATNRNLEKEVQEGQFRADLYYRLNVFPVELPALSVRKNDIPILVDHFIQKLSVKMGKKVTTISKNALNELIQYNWPGNIRELEHTIERCILLAEDTVIRQATIIGKKTPVRLSDLAQNDFSFKTIYEIEREHILNTLKYCHGRVSGINGAAQFLGIPSTTLHSKIKRLKIIKEHFAA